MGTVGIYLHYGTFVGPPAGVALLIMAFAYKLLEIYTKRDAYVVTVLAYFVVATEFLFNQSIPMAVYSVFSLLAITASLIGLNQSQSHRKPWRTARLSGLILAQCVPLMLVLFILVPRIGPLWSLDFDAGGDSIGLSDTMSPGDFNNLTRSTSLAFRAKFEGNTPEPNQLYWRGLILYDFDGKTWSKGSAKLGEHQRNSELVYWPGDKRSAWFSEYNQDFSKQILATGDPESLKVFRYEVTLEPSDQTWLFGLDMPLSRQKGIGLSRDFRLLAKAPIDSVFRYQAESIVGINVDLDLPPWIKARALQLPEGTNYRALALAKRWRLRAGSDRGMIAKVLSHFNTQPFVYTLRTDKLGDNIVDDFLFDTQRGFCIHYAGSFSFLMRAAGIPARVVVGYLGGELNTLGDYLLVHQFDAHAWVEVWLEGEGWVRIDPTGAVAPERIESGIEQALAAENSFLDGVMFSALKYRDIAFINNLRLSVDYINMVWHERVLGYDSDLQNEFLVRLLGEVSPRRIAMALFLSGLLVMLLVSLLLFSQRSRKKTDPITLIYLKFCEKMSKAGITRMKGEGPDAFASRIETDYMQLGDSVTKITQAFSQLVYRDQSPEAEGEKQQRSQAEKKFKKMVREFSPHKLMR
ncbi:MAG: transglutaminase [Gammaproteobacteria bacterium]|nr:MAG: transglutaminase [Gammaproteobacteria bacterium]